jgi:hypothetical protein
MLPHLFTRKSIYSCSKYIIFVKNICNFILDSYLFSNFANMKRLFILLFSMFLVTCRYRSKRQCVTM